MNFLTRALFPAKPTPAGERKRVNLALQGGGSLGAFTWGVLDKLLEDDRLEIEGVSGASAGAMNAVMLADGLARGGRDEARKRLAAFWRAASSDGNLSFLQRKAVSGLAPLGGTPAGLWMKAMGNLLSPYEMNPLNINPLKDLVERFVDFEAVRAYDALRLTISATNVQTGQLKIFERDELTADMVLASACLPLLFQTVEVEGVPYWDGGYVSNPPLFPLLRQTQTEDLVLVQINPVARHDVPKTRREIVSRVSEITFNSSLMAELRGIELIGRLIDEGKLPRGLGPGEYRRVNVHRIALESPDAGVDADSSLKTDFAFFGRLRREGAAAAEAFLSAHFADIGVRGTIDLNAGNQNVAL